MATIKTYKYVYNNVTYSVDVTFEQGACVLGLQGANGEETYYSDVTVSIPSAIEVDLYVDILVTKEVYSYADSGTTSYYEQIKIPVGALSQKESKICKYVEGTTTETYAYELADQRNVESPPPELAISYTKEDASCFGASNGGITISTMGGTSPFTYDWSDGGPNQPNRTGLPAGSYGVNVTDSAGQSAGILGIEITQPTQIAATFTVVDCSCYGGGNGSIDVVTSGGTGAHTFMWSDGSTAKNRSSLSAGKYTLTVTDEAACSRSFEVTVGQPTQIKITTNVSGRDVTVSVSGGVPAYSYHWSDNVTVKDRTGLADGTYTITVRDANNCIATATVVITSFKFYFSKNPVLLQLQAVDPATKPNLSFQLSVYLEENYKSETFDKKYETEHPARANGSTDFDVREVLNAFLSVQVPAYSESQPVQVADAFKRFYLQYNEVYGEPPLPAPFTQVDTFYVLFGGLSEQEFAKNTFFESYLDAQKPFLSWQPRKKQTTAAAHEYLHFVVHNTLYTELQLWARIKYKSGVENIVQLRSVSSVGTYEVYRFPAGYSQLQIGSFLPSEEVSSYTLYLKFGQEVVSEERTYKLVPDASFHKVYLYLNSLGGWDTLVAKGRGKTSLRTSEEVIDRELPVEYSYSTRAQEVTSKSGRKTARVVIGNLTNAEKRHLVDLAISEQVYEQTASGYLPVRVKFDFDPSDEMEELDQEVSFDVMYPQTNRYTPEL